ncbi:hypothetical protein F4778DRAFT_717147 [Xylariomycetidae sp. FL2044]|nr:hypothetical protein F4778DRAFT_717147 [Xylariomycetidae sp. FL2044]
MQLNLLLLLSAAASQALSAAVPASTAALSSENLTVEVFPDGLPADLIPRAASGDSLEKREDAGVYLCVDAHFLGYCQHIYAPLYQCVNLSGDLNDLVSSVGPDSPYYCLFYRAFSCSDSEGHFGAYSPGYETLGSVNSNDQISSYVCYPN